jgi:Tol biopolymer transport system component
MTSDRWRQVEELCHAALARPSAERAAFLTAACAGDEALRREVESLLAQEPDAAGFMSAPAALATSVLLGHAKGGLVGRCLGTYEVRALLGVGGMGEVYRAYDKALCREVAIKVLPAAFAADPQWRARFEREARILATLNNSHIGAIYGIEEAADVRALVLELIEGETLAERIARFTQDGGLPTEDVLAIARQIVDALDTAHQKGIVHRDLKPANIKVSPDGTVKVLDFGLAKAASPDSSRPDLAESHEGVILGTAAYMSPEQARGQSVDRRSDVWAFGCVLYEMLTGRLAFPGETASDTIASILGSEPDWSAIPAATPAHLRRLLLRCLVKDPRRRLRDMADVGIEIDSADDVLPGPKGGDDAGRAARSRSAWTIWTPWILVAVIAAAVAAWEVSRPIAPPGNPLDNARFTRFTDWDGTEGDAEISPDGRFVAFIADRDGEFDLWVSQVGTAEFRNLTADLPSLGPPSDLFRTIGFTGDGAEIWFSVSADPVMSRKMIVPLSGGLPRPFLGEGEAEPAWSHDGARLVYFNNNKSRGDVLLVADRTAGDARPIQITPSDPDASSSVRDRVHIHNPAWSADDRWLYFTRGFVRRMDWTDEMDLWRVPAGGGSPERLENEGSAVTSLAPIDARTLIYVARAADGSGPWLWTADTERKIVRRASSGLEQYTSIAASRDGRRLVATIINPTSTLWSVPILDRPAQDGDVRPIGLPTGRVWGPRFAGASLFYLSGRGTPDGLWRFQDGRTFEVRKGADGALLEPPAVFRDASRVAVVYAKDRRRRLAIVSADGTGFHGLAESLDVLGTVDWSPDGAWIVAGGRDSTQGPGLFTIPVEGGTPVRLVAGQAANPVWSPDGSLIVYGGPIVTGQVLLMGVRPDGTAVEMPPVRARSSGYRFLPDGTGLAYLPRGDSGDFRVLDLATKRTRQLTQFRSQGRLGAFDITPDGTRLVFDKSRDNSDVVLIDLPKR